MMMMMRVAGLGLGLGNVEQCSPQETQSWKMKQSPPMRMTLTKQGERFLRKIGSSSASGTTQNLIQRFVLSSPKSVVLTTLSHLLSPSTSYSYPHLSTLAFPLYARITQAPWFTWTPTTAAQLAALLHQLGHHAQAQSLISEATSKLESRPRQLVLFYGKLMDSHSKRASQTGFDVAYGYLNHLLRTSSSLHVKQTAYQYMVSGFCAMDRPREAYDFALGPGLGLVPSAFELKSIVYAYGRLGLFEDMVRVVDEMAKRGFVVDTVCYNMVLSTYGTHGEHLHMLGWLRRMRAEAVPFSIRTYNSVTNCCPSILRMTQNLDGLALGLQELKEGLEGGEGMVIGELLGCRLILEEVMVWDSSEVKLDLHGFHLGGAYLIVLLWLEEMRRRMGDANYGVPAQVTLVSGMGKHSSVRGESRVRVLVQKMMVKMGSPLKVHRTNNGCFIAKGKAVKNWFCQFRNTLN